MATTDELFRLYYNQFRKLYPNGTDDELRYFLRRRMTPDQYRKSSNFIDRANATAKAVQAETEAKAAANIQRLRAAEAAAKAGNAANNAAKAGSVANNAAKAGNIVKGVGDVARGVLNNPIVKGLGTVARVGSVPFSIYQGLEQPLGTDEQLRQQHEEAMKNGFIPNVGYAPANRNTNIANPLLGIGFNMLAKSPLGYGLDLIHKYSQAMPSNEYNNRLTSYSGSDVVHYNQLDGKPEARAEYETMMREKAAGGTGDVARREMSTPSQETVPTEELTNEEVAAEAAQDAQAVDSLPPATGLNTEQVALTDTGVNNNIEGIPTEEEINNMVTNDVNPSGEPPVLRSSAPVPGQQEAVTTDTSAVDSTVPLSTSDALYKQLTSTEGQITPQDMRAMIDKYYDNMRVVANQNPLYGGGYIQPGGYHIDPEMAEFMARRDALDASTGVNSRNFYKGYTAPLEARYYAEMANKAGVPYDDYKTGMLERNKQELELAKQQVTDQLTAYQLQSNDMTTKLRIAQQIAQVQEGYDAKIREIEAQARANQELERIRGKYNIGQELVKGDISYKNETLKQQGELAKEYYKANNPIAVMVNASKAFFNNAVAFGGDIAALARYYASLPAEQQIMQFGKVLTPEQYYKMFGAAQEQAKRDPGWLQRAQNWLMYNNTDGNFGY